MRDPACAAATATIFLVLFSGNVSSSLTPQQKPQSLRVLKAVVIGLAVLIAVGLAVVVITIVNRLGGSGGGRGARDLGTITHAIPAGAEVAGMTADDGRLYLRLRLADGTTRIDVLDAATGRRIGVIAVTREAP